MNLAIDIGNSLVKLAQFDHGKLMGDVVTTEYSSLATELKGLSPDKVIVSSVNQNTDELENLFRAKTVNLTHATPLPIKIKYGTPKTLGNDRIAAVIGAFLHAPNTNSLVIDIGTCITYDFINSDNEYLGGGISPGIDMKLKALHTFTAGLPLVKRNEQAELIGNSTENSILSGIINGTKAEIEEIIRMYTNKFSHLRIIMCGGGCWINEE